MELTVVREVIQRTGRGAMKHAAPAHVPDCTQIGPRVLVHIRWEWTDTLERARTRRERQFHRATDTV
jgi:hypothetical protein